MTSFRIKIEIGDSVVADYGQDSRFGALESYFGEVDYYGNSPRPENVNIRLFSIENHISQPVLVKEQEFSADTVTSVLSRATGIPGGRIHAFGERDVLDMD